MFDGKTSNPLINQILSIRKKSDAFHCWLPETEISGRHKFNVTGNAQSWYPDSRQEDGRQNKPDKGDPDQGNQL